MDGDCPGAETCINIGSKTEVAWWDNRTDGAVNDLATFAVTQDSTNLYIAAELWVDPDPVSLPFAEMAIDFKPGGLKTWHDPKSAMGTPGRCSGRTDRACTSNADCHFCQISEEPTGACSNDPTQACIRGDDASCGGPSDTCVERKRACGSACDEGIGDSCDTSRTCIGIGADGLVSGIGNAASPDGGADLLIAFDFGIWLLGFDLENGVLLLEPGVDLTAPPLAGPYFGPWKAITGCPNDSPDDPTDRCDFVPVVNPGASGGSGGPPGSVEVAIPWSAFAGTGFGPGQDFRFTVAVARGVTDFDFKPDGAIEDVFSESVALATTTSTDSCSGFGVVTTDCEVRDDTIDSYIPRTPPLAHELAAGGRVNLLTVAKSGGSSVTLDWFPSCSTADNAYGVYEGVIGGVFDNHVQVPGGSCGIGSTSFTFVPSAGNRYYLVVPTDGTTEGSYGTDSASNERQVSTAPCATQALGSCP